MDCSIPNCRHTLITYFPGITRLPVVPDGKEAIKLYEKEQKQRMYERQIRKWKRVYNGSLDEDNKSNANMKIKNYQKMLRKLLSENKELRRNNYREQI